MGDALFLVEGSPVNCRVVNDELEHLRRPFRPLLGGFALGEALPALTRLVKRAIPALNALRVGLSPQSPGLNAAPLNPRDSSLNRHEGGASEDRASKFVWGPGEVMIVDAPPRSSELGLVPIEVALAKVEALRPGSHSGAVLNPFEAQPGPTMANELDSERYTFTKLRVDALKHLIADLDKAKLTAIIKGDGDALPIIIGTEAGYFIWREPEAVVAKWLLGDDEVLVRIGYGYDQQ